MCQLCRLPALGASFDLYVEGKLGSCSDVNASMLDARNNTNAASTCHSDDMVTREHQGSVILAGLAACCASICFVAAVSQSC